jgi:hypothetical protein
MLVVFVVIVINDVVIIVISFDFVGENAEKKFESENEKCIRTGLPKPTGIHSNIPDLSFKTKTLIDCSSHFNTILREFRRGSSRRGRSARWSLARTSLYGHASAAAQVARVAAVSSLPSEHKR